jgi:nitrous oxidase accessory protein NosD
MKQFIWGILFFASAAQASFNLQEAIDKAKSGSVITIPKGSYTEPISIKKGISLKSDGAVLEVTSNKPAILIDTYKPVLIEGLIIKWKRVSKPQKGDTPYAVFVRAGEVVLNNCSFEALGSGDTSPCAAAAQDKSEMEIRNSLFEGFEYTIQFWNGAKGSIADCIVMNPGHCGITIGNGSKVELTRNIITGSRYHGIRCTGGEITAQSNLVIRNKNRGFYIGNKSSLGVLSNNLIVDNATGINVFAHSKIEIENNVIVRSSYAGLCIADTSKVETQGNIIAENEKGVVGFSAEKGKEPSVSLTGKNLVHNNKTESEHIKLPAKTLTEDPTFKDEEEGLFASGISNMGLEDPEGMQMLWKKWQAALDNR